jgi:plastocyanin
MQPKLLVFGLVLASILLLGCTGGQPQQNANQTQNATPTQAAKAPSFTISAPTDGQVVSIDGDRGDVTLTLSTQNLVLKAPGGAAVKGEGHFRVTVDGSQPVNVLTRSYIMPGLVPGTYTVKVELLNNDNTQYAPAIGKTLSFSVKTEAPEKYVPVNYNVTINNLAYTPSDLTAKVGDTITFDNTGSFPMSATCFIGGAQMFDTKVLGPNKMATVTLGQEMDCTYYSTTQRLVTGHVLVGSNSTG